MMNSPETGAPGFRFVYWTAFFCLLVSGIAALVYQVVWMRYLALFMGHTSYAVVAVLVVFMGGLALGNALLGSLADRVRRPLALYGWLEIVIGIYAWLFPWYFEVAQSIYFGLAAKAGMGGAMALGLKFAFGLAMLFVPTVLMGGVLPVLTRLVTRTLGELQERVSALYFVNSAGAVMGVVLAEFWLIPGGGLQMTVFLAAAMNLVAGAGALGMSGYLGEENNEAPQQSSTTPASVEQQGSVQKLILWLIALSGFVAMLYEVAWARMLGMVLGSSSHGFSVMLITFISGIAVGAWFIGRWRGVRDRVRLFAWLEILVGCTIFASLFTFEYLPYWFVRFANVLNRTPEAYPLYHLVQASICFLVMFVPTVCLGMTLPLVSRIATEEVSKTGRRVGLVFSVNTVGTVLGAALTGLVLLPLLGLSRVFGLGIAVNVVIGMVILMRGADQLRRFAFVGLPLLVLGIVSFAGGRFGTTWQWVLTQGLWRRAAPPASMEEVRRLAYNSEILYHRDGTGATVTVNSYDSDEDNLLSLRVNGKVDASTAGDMLTQLLSGHIPLLLHPRAENVLVVGLGSGITCGAVLRYETVQRLDTVEISPEVVEAARFFKKANDDALNNERMHLAVEDAKSFLKLTEHEYDVIISEPSNPWLAGVSGVFSAEYYEDCRSKLKPGGVMAQRVQLYETNNDALQTVLATFSFVFPHLSIWMGMESDLILIGSLEPLSVDLEDLEARFYRPRIHDHFKQIDILRFPVFLTTELVSHQNGYFTTPDDALVHSDFFPRLEYLAQRGFFERRVANYWAQFNELYSPRPTTLLGRYLSTHTLSQPDFRAIASFFLERKTYDPEYFRTILNQWLRQFGDDPLALAMSAEIADFRTPWGGEVAFLGGHREAILKQAESDTDLLRKYAKYLLQDYRSSRSAFHIPDAAEIEMVLKRLIELDPSFQRVYRMHLAELSWDRGDDERFFELAGLAFSQDFGLGPTNYEFDDLAPYRTLALMIETYWRQGNITEAWSVCQQAIAGKYLGNDALQRLPALDLAFRKTSHSMFRLQEQGDGGAIEKNP
ncbi:MAG: Polyamine aminopropyltransferase [Verrucomicrobia subdivision 3 bacterium]|nr:Polyamine aminopropyltransferase [Limisphaerales bacterium]MCS1412494.1 Polyamine aminopropyltransferase [Limisphaerales bacterium]